MTKLVYFSSGGTPVTGLSPTWNTLKKVSDGTAFSQPAISEVGGGWYKFDINPTETLTGVVDGGASVAAGERYVPVYFDKFDYLFEALLTPVYNEDTDSLTFSAFLLQNGLRVTTGMTNCQIDVYNSAHVLQFTVTGTINTNGVFVITKSSPGLVKNTSYYAVATITLNSVTYDTLDTYISLE